jgi:hypothetical protein
MPIRYGLKNAHWVLGAYDKRWHRIVRLEGERNVPRATLECNRTEMEVDAMLTLNATFRIDQIIARSELCTKCAERDGGERHAS